MKCALTIAGSDSGGGAGIQADLKTFAALGVYGTCAITAITAQNTVGIEQAVGLSADLVTAQIEAVASDIAIDATKTGMLLTAAIVEAAAAAIEELQLPKVVVDPVMIASDGHHLLSADGIRALKAELLPRAMIVTPNLPEASTLAGIDIRSLEDAREAARRIRDLGPTAVVVTGGHAPGSDIIDVLYDGHAFVELRTTRVESRSTHGTGCTFSSAVAAHLALGSSLAESVALAQAYVAGAIRLAVPIGKGRGPLNHFWRSR